MPKMIDLCGQRFGSLTAIRPMILDEKKNESRYLCRCDCGRYLLVRVDNLQNGHSTQCSACKHEGCRPSHFVWDLPEDTVTPLIITIKWGSGTMTVNADSLISIMRIPEFRKWVKLFRDYGDPEDQMAFLKRLMDRNKEQHAQLMLKNLLGVKPWADYIKVL